ncbi:hypothetical protein T439DRAFT_327555 [Meredithblackwellia eburnea MCA 4105]
MVAWSSCWVRLSSFFSLPLLHPLPRLLRASAAQARSADERCFTVSFRMKADHHCAIARHLLPFHLGPPLLAFSNQIFQFSLCRKEEGKTVKKEAFEEELPAAKRARVDFV